MHALIENGSITAIRNAPDGGAWEDDAWLDFSDPEVLAAWEQRHGWVKVTEAPKPEETETTKAVESFAVVDGVPVQKWTTRALNTAEVAEKAAREEHAADHEAIRALFIRIDESLTEAKAVRALVQTAIDAAAPTTVPQLWTRQKDALQLLRRTTAVQIDIAQDTKAIAKVLRDS